MEFNQINLTTHDHVDRRILFGALGSVTVLLVFFTVFNTVSGIQAYRERASYRSKIKNLQLQAKTIVSVDAEGAALDAEGAETLQKRSRFANHLIALDIFPWVHILDELEKTIPPQIVLDQFLPDADLKTIRIAGHTSSVEPITEFQNALEKSEILQSVVLENMDFGSGTAGPKSNGGGGAMQFEMICGLDLKALFPEEQYGNLWMTLTSMKAGNVGKR